MGAHFARQNRIIYSNLVALTVLRCFARGKISDEVVHIVHDGAAYATASRPFAELRPPRVTPLTGLARRERAGRRGKMSRRTTTTTTAAPPPAAAAPAAAAACSATESSATRGKPPQSLTEDEIDERLWHGAATQGWTVFPRGDIEASRRNCTWTYVSPDGTKHRRRADAVEAHHADIDRRLWAGAAEQGWQVQPHALPPC